MVVSELFLLGAGAQMKNMSLQDHVDCISYEVDQPARTLLTLRLLNEFFIQLHRTFNKLSCRRTNWFLSL